MCLQPTSDSTAAAADCPPHTNSIPPVATTSLASCQMTPGELPQPACRAAQKSGGLMFPAQPCRNGDERPLNRCPSLLLLEGQFEILLPRTSGAPARLSAFAHRGNRLVNTLFVALAPSPRLSLLPGSLPYKLPKSTTSEPQPCLHAVQKPCPARGEKRRSRL